eukprot:TRINITY_DN8427_c0_g1_i1.p1 TRINITY_DN8427_c0_g1~~TRINITY_DN8427_c0_g1_i1.p1  ORF type:complete len:900 (+),score=188.00 TRINITY_DN8427_c0_g1_i1:367-2700(+)
MDGTVDQASYTPRVGPYTDGTPSYAYERIEAVFNRIIAYKNRRHGIWARGGLLRFDNCILADNQFCYNAPPGPTMLSNSLCIGETDNVGTIAPFESWEEVYTDRTRFNQWRQLERMIGVETYDAGGPQYAHNVTFVDFQHQKNSSGDIIRPAGALSVLDAHLVLDTRNRYSEFTMQNSNPVWISDSGRENTKGVALLDMDGTVTGISTGAWIVSNTPLLVDPEVCTDHLADWNAFACPVDAHPRVQLIFSADLPAAEKTDAFYEDDGELFSRGQMFILGTNLESDGVGLVGDRSGNDYTFEINVRARKAYTFRWGNPETNEHTGVSWGNDLEIIMRGAVGDWVIVAVPYKNSNGNTATVEHSRYGGARTTMEKVDSVDDLELNKFCYDSDSEHLYLWIQNVADNDDFLVDFDRITDYDFDGFSYFINAGCEVCDLDNLAIPEEPKLKEYEDQYVAVACDGEDLGDAVAYMHLDPDLNHFRVTVYHPWNDKVVDANLVDLDDNNRVLHDYEGVLSSPIRFADTISHPVWKRLLSGRIQLQMELENGDMKTASILCNGDCTTPHEIPDVDACNPDDPNVYDIFTDGPYAWPAFPQIFAQDFMSKNEESTGQVLCGTNSLQFTNWNGSAYVSINQPDSEPAINIDPAVFTYFEFWAYLETVSELGFRIQLSSRTQDYELTELSTKNYHHYKLVSGLWTRVRVSLADLGATGPFDLKRIVLISHAWDHGELETLYIDAMRFVGDSEEPMASGFDSEVKTAQECGYPASASQLSSWMNIFSW